MSGDAGGACDDVPESRYRVRNVQHVPSFASTPWIWFSFPARRATATKATVRWQRFDDINGVMFRRDFLSGGGRNRRSENDRRTKIGLGCFRALALRVPGESSGRVRNEQVVS
jgi:hypothetical protein